MWSSQPMRRHDRLVSKEEATALLQQAEYGVLASANAEGLPLATPLSFVLLDGAIYFHSALKGHKVDNLAAQSRVSFCVVGPTKPLIDSRGDFTTLYSSVVAHGTAHTVQDAAEKEKALMALCEKYLPGQPDLAQKDIEKSGNITLVVRIDIDELSGKAKKS